MPDGQAGADQDHEPPRGHDGRPAEGNPHHPLRDRLAGLDPVVGNQGAPQQVAEGIRGAADGEQQDDRPPRSHGLDQRGRGHGGGDDDEAHPFRVQVEEPETGVELDQRLVDDLLVHVPHPDQPVHGGP